MKRLSQLAISKEGFVFDPLSGESFTVNPTGQFILKRIIAGISANDIVERITKQFNVQRPRVESDVTDFYNQLKLYHLIPKDNGRIS